MFVIDGSKMTNRQEAYQELKKALEAPDYMGNNLDALYDVLTEMRGEIVLTHACVMLNSLRKFGLSLLEVFYDAAGDNRYITFTLGMKHDPEDAKD